MWSSRCRVGIRVLAVGSLVLAAGGVFYEQGVKRGRARETAELHGRIVEGQRFVAEAEKLEFRAVEATRPRALVDIDLPPGSAQVWLPPMVKKHFANAALEVSVIRLNSIQEIPETPNFRRGYWSIGVPVEEDGKNIPAVLTTLAQLEKQNPYLRVLDFSIAADPENPGKRIAGMNLTTLVAR
jgi:hypothetical protein